MPASFETTIRFGVTQALRVATSVVLSTLVFYAPRVEAIPFHYALVMAKDVRLCSDVRSLLNRFFIDPWSRGRVINGIWKPLYGVDPQSVFQRLPGVEFQPAYVDGMFYTRYPMAPGFDVPQWREGRYDAGTEKVGTYLVGKDDVFNDGNPRTIVKYGFFRYGGVGFGDDRFVIFDEEHLPDPAKLTLADFYDRQAIQVGPSAGSWIRPFRHAARFYLLAGIPVDGDIAPLPRKGAPFTDQLGVLRVLQLRSSTTLDENMRPNADVEELCRYRMTNTRPRYPSR